MIEEKIIKSILVDGQGYKYAEKQIDGLNDSKGRQPMGTYRIEKNPIEIIKKNGEMAEVDWYKQGDTEWNGKYIIEVNYYSHD